MLTEFDPVKLSLDENRFVRDNIGKPPVVGLQNRPAQVTLAAVKPIIERAYELIETEKYSGQKWVGVEAVKAAIDTYISQAEKWAANKGRRGAPRFPSMYAWDNRGRGFLGGAGSDSGQVRTYFDSTGNRVPFAIKLIPDGEEDWKPDWIAATPAVVPTELVVNSDANRIECFCGHTEQFKQQSRASYNAARARMSKHLRKATDRPDDHRALHQAEFS